MSSNAEYFIKKTLGTDFLESFESSLSKSEVYRPGTRTTTNLDDVWQGLMIVPKVLMRLLIQELTPMQIGQLKRISLPVENTVLDIQRHERDTFSGSILQNNRKINEFMYRSIPGIGLIILSTLELYNVDNLDKGPKLEENLDNKINSLIEERLNLHSLINQVVDGKLAQKDAINQLLMARLMEQNKEKEETKRKIQEIRDIQEHSTPQSEEYFRGMTNGIEVVNSVVNEKEPEFVHSIEESEKQPTTINLKFKKKPKIQVFIEGRKKKKKNKEFFFKMDKSETVRCPDCGQTIFNDSNFSSCICLGESKGIRLKKTEEGVKISFGKSWDTETIEMLLEVLRNKNESSR